MKRIFDVVMVALTAPFWGLPVLLLALSVKLHDGGPAFFRQTRVGLRGRTFRILKLRTMSTEPDESMRRVTRPGAFLRERGWDELPQLVNVFLGDMSLVGPRPLTVSDVNRLTAQCPRFSARQAVRPGLTGLAQVTRARGVESTAAVDAEYAASASLFFDLKLLAKTVVINVVGKKRGWAQRVVAAPAGRDSPLM